jgi:hypothetical protein
MKLGYRRILLVMYGRLKGDSDTSLGGWLWIANYKVTFTSNRKSPNPLALQWIQNEYAKTYL